MIDTTLPLKFYVGLSIVFLIVVTASALYIMLLFNYYGTTVPYYPFMFGMSVIPLFVVYDTEIFGSRYLDMRVFKDIQGNTVHVKLNRVTGNTVLKLMDVLGWTLVSRQGRLCTFTKN